MAGRDPKPRGEKSRSGQALIAFEALNPAEGTPKPPDHLDAHGVFAWVTACRSLIPQRLVSHIDLIALEMFAASFARWRKCEADCRARGEYSKTPNGHRQISEYRVNANRALAQVMSIGAKLGMTPVERIKTTESAQGDLPLGDPVAPDRKAGESDDVVALASVFRPRRVELVHDREKASE